MKKGLLIAVSALAAVLAVCGCNDKKDDTISLRNLDMSQYVELPEYKGLTYSMKEYDVSEEEIQAQMDVELQNAVSKIGLLDKEVENGDKIYVSLNCYVDDVAVEGTALTGEWFTVGDGTMEKVINDGFIGMKAGEIKTVNVSFPDDYKDTRLAGKDTVLRFGLLAVLPNPIDDEVIAKMGSSDYRTVKQFHDFVKAEITARITRNMEDSIKSDLINQVYENAVFKEVPAEYTDEVKRELVNKYTYEAGLLNLTPEEYILGRFNVTIDEMAVNYLHMNMVVEAIAQKEGFSMNDEYYYALIDALALEQGIQREHYFLMNNVADNESYRMQLASNKVLQLLYDNAVCTD